MNSFLYGNRLNFASECLYDSKSPNRWSGKRLTLQIFQFQIARVYCSELRKYAQTELNKKWW